MEIALPNLLLASAPLKALVGNKVFWDELPQGLEYPAIILFDVTSRTTYTYQGASGLMQSRVQFDCRGMTRAQARAVLAAMDARLSGFHGQFEGFRFDGCFRQGERSRADRDGASRWFTASVDYLIWWAASA